MLKNNLVSLTDEWNTEENLANRKFHRHHLIIQETDTEHCKDRKKRKCIYYE